MKTYEDYWVCKDESGVVDVYEKRPRWNRVEQCYEGSWTNIDNCIEDRLINWGMIHLKPHQSKRVRIYFKIKAM